MVGIPTVLITVIPDSSRPAGPPRAIYPYKFKPGNSLGGPHQPDLQRKVLRDALRRWETREEPGNIWEIAYPEYDSSQWQSALPQEEN
jgi:D-proline reductase (dithiol) PrdB